MKEGKAWGETTLVYNSQAASVHYLKIKPGGFCSEHRHTRKKNLFHVLRGRLSVLVWKTEGPGDRTDLQAGDTFTVDPGQWHKFETTEGAEILEIYEARLEGPDIERRSTGGIQRKAGGQPGRSGEGTHLINRGPGLKS